MSQEEQKKEPRVLEEIQKEYQQATLRAGDLQYRIFAHQKDLKLVNDRLVELNFEGLARQEADKKKELEAAQEAAPAIIGVPKE